MRNPPDPRLSQARVRTGLLRSDDSLGNVGAFSIKGPRGTRLTIVASNGMGWEHVSVSCKSRCPSWNEMCWVKDLFWNDEEAVVQYHPPKSTYIDCHPHCLHLWKPLLVDLPLPPEWMVGPCKKGQHNAPKVWTSRKRSAIR